VNALLFLASRPAPVIKLAGLGSTGLLVCDWLNNVQPQSVDKVLFLKKSVPVSMPTNNESWQNHLWAKPLTNMMQRVIKNDFAFNDFAGISVAPRFEQSCVFQRFLNSLRVNMLTRFIPLRWMAR